MEGDGKPMGQNHYTMVEDGKPMGQNQYTMIGDGKLIGTKSQYDGSGW